MSDNEDVGDHCFIYEGDDEDILLDVTRVNVHPSVKAIKYQAFYGCSQLSIANLGEGLEEIGEAAFFECTSLNEITNLSAVKTIKKEAFYRCSQLTIVTLGEGLKEIGDGLHKAT
jgi:hypothetical protein